MGRELWVNVLVVTVQVYSIRYLINVNTTLQTKNFFIELVLGLIIIIFSSGKFPKIGLHELFNRSLRCLVPTTESGTTYEGHTGTRSVTGRDPRSHLPGPRQVLGKVEPVRH